MSPAPAKRGRRKGSARASRYADPRYWERVLRAEGLGMPRERPVTFQQGGQWRRGLQVDVVKKHWSAEDPIQLATVGWGGVVEPQTVSLRERDNLRQQVLADRQAALALFSEVADVLRSADLTERERRALELFAEGHGQNAIAARLGLGRQVVRDLLRNVLGRHGIHPHKLTRR